MRPDYLRSRRRDKALAKLTPSADKGAAGRTGNDNDVIRRVVSSVHGAGIAGYSPTQLTRSCEGQVTLRTNLPMLSFILLQII